MNNYQGNCNIEYARNFEEDEISLVDIAATIIRRWRWVVGVFLFCMIAGFGATFYYSFFIGEPMEYVSIYNVAEDLNSKPLIPLKSTEEKINLYYKDDVEKDYTKEKKIDGLSFKNKISTSKDSGVVIIKSSSMEDSYEKIGMIEDVHKKILETISSEESDVLTYKKEVIERNLKNFNQAVDLLKGAESSSAKESLVYYMDKVVELENRLSGFQSGEILKLASEKKVSQKKPKLVLILLAFSSFFIALITPFFIEFGINIRESLKEDNEKIEQK